MMPFMGIFSITISIVYVVFILIVLIFFYKRRKNSIDENSKGVSIIIPYRNEEKNLKKLWDSLSRQKKCNAEFLFVNDSSDDNSEGIVNTFSSSSFLIQKLSLPSTLPGKKSAIEFGIEKASYEKIITLDADCIPNSDFWISSHQSNNHKDSAILGGGVFICPSNNIWNQIQETENLATQTISSGLANMNHPIAISGGNMSYEKSFFKKLDPYSNNREVGSGDDIYFLQKAKKSNGKVVLDLTEELSVNTSPSSFSKYFGQRLRWMKKGSSFQDLTTILVGLLIFFSQATFLFSAVYQMINHEIIPELLISMALKIGIDFLLLFLVALKFKRAVLILSFIPAFIFSILAFVFIISLGWLVPVQWKGRKI